MNYSASIKLRHPARRDGSCQILLLVVIHRKPHPIGLGVGWFPELFDEEKGVCLSSRPKRERSAGYELALSTAVAWAGGTIEKLEEKARDFNLIIGKAVSKAHDVFVHFRLSGQTITSESCVVDYNTEASKQDFIAYMEAKITERSRRGKGHRERIGEVTRKNHTSTLNCLKAFRKTLPFYSLGPKFADDFHAYLLKNIKGVNTRWGRHKDVKAYLALAKKDRIRFENPYQDFENKSEKGKWKPLKSSELAKLKVYYTQLPVGSAWRRVLQRFLFSCCSSLRLGDLKNLKNAQLDGRELIFQIQKTYEQKLQVMMLPLTKEAMTYLEDSRREEGIAGFFNYTDQYSNRALQRIGQELGIETKLHHHIGRETFATEFIRRGGKVEVLQKLMDHEKIETTMKYVHVDDEMKRDAIRMLDALRDEPSMAIMA